MANSVIRKIWIEAMNKCSGKCKWEKGKAGVITQPIKGLPARKKMSEILSHNRTPNFTPAVRYNRVRA